jgi:hypothetical protein
MSAALTRRLSRAALLVASWLLLAAVAQAATPISVTASPKTVSRGQRVTLRGSGWGVIEFCKARVTLTLKRSLPFGPLPIATVNLRTAPKTSGTFSTSWVVPTSVHSGLRTIVATQRCESGKNGSLVLITRSTTVRVR